MYDVIIVGIGSMGSSALYHLAKQGVKVLGIEQFDVAHEHGSHSGQSRIVRKAYFEHPDYVPLLEGAYKGWKALEFETGEQFYHPSGIAYFGESDHFVMEGMKESAKRYDIPLNHLAETEYPVFNLPNNYERLFEPNAGFVLTEPAIQTYCKLALKNGATLATNEKVLGWSLSNGIVEIITSKKTYKTKKVIFATGAYTKKVAPGLSRELKVTRQFLSWVKPKNEEQFQLGNFPCWMISDKAHPGIFYGFPSLPTKKFGGNGLMKVGHHLPGEVMEVENLHTIDATKEEKKLAAILEEFIPDALGEMVSSTVCMYNNTPDEHFIIDFHPNTNNQVVIASGFCGHGFKFVPVVGEILTDLTLEEKTDWPTQFLKLGRF